MKKIVKQIILVFLLMNLGLTVALADTPAAGTGGSTPPVTTPPAPPAQQTQYGPLKVIQDIGKKTQLPNFYETGQHPDAPADYLQQGVGTVTSPIYYLLDLIRYFMSGIALLVIVVQAIKLISTANEEEAGKSKTTLLVGIVGLIVIQLADVMVKKMFFGEQGEAFEDITTAQLYAEETVSKLRNIIGFVEAFIAAGAMLVIIIRGITLMGSGGEEEKMTKAKNHIIYAIVGIVIVILAEVIVRGVIFPEAGKVLPDVSKGKFIIVQLTNYLAGFVSIIAFLSLFYAGYKYVVAGGQEETGEKTKKIILGAVIALVLSLGAFAIINTVIKLEPLETANTEQQ